MTAIKPRDVPGLLKARNTAHAAYLVYGNDSGSVREHSDLIAHQVVSDLKDPFNFIELSEGDLRDEPGRLADEITALSFMGGERVVRVRGSGGPVDAAAKLLIKGLDDGSVKPNGITIIEAGSLKKTAPLRKLFEKSTHAAAIACYEDNDVDLRSMIEAMLGQENLRITDDALALLSATLGTDRGISRAEMEKLILYVGPKTVRLEPYEITQDDVAACLADFTQDMANDVAALVAEGRLKDLSTILYRAEEAGTNAITILIYLQRHFTRLYAAQGLITAGDPPSAALKKLRPPVFYNEERSFHAQLKKWPLPRLEMALANLLQAEHDAKTGGAPVKEIIERTALRLSAMAGR